MTALNTAASVLCASAVICALMSLIVPYDRMKKAVNLVLSLFLICSLILPVKSAIEQLSLDETFSEYDESISFSQEDFNKAVLKETANSLVLCADELLKNEGLKANDIKLSLRISDEGSIYVGSVLIYISREYEDKAGEIEKIIYRNFSKEPQIIVEKE